jgi:hypothetical protein
MLLESVLSHRKVFETYNKASKFITNWTLQNDIGPFEQLPELNPLTFEREDFVGVTLS